MELIKQVMNESYWKGLVFGFFIGLGVLAIVLGFEHKGLAGGPWGYSLSMLVGCVCLFITLINLTFNGCPDPKYIHKHLSEEAILEAKIVQLKEEERCSKSIAEKKAKILELTQHVAVTEGQNVLADYNFGLKESQ